MTKIANKMMVAAAVKNRNRDREYRREMESEMRQRRDQYGRYIGETAYGGADAWDSPEMRRQRDSRGRYMTDGWNDYQQPMIGFDREYRTNDLMPMEYDRRMPNRMASTYSGYDGDIYARGSIIMSPKNGGYKGDMRSMMDEEMYYAPVDEMTAHKWTKSLKNADGTEGAHFKPEQTEQMRQQHAPECDKWEFMVAMNMMYADYCKSAKSLGVDRPDFYALMARDFLCDKDAGKNKLQKYMEVIPK